MNTVVTLPLWLFVLILLFAAVTASTHLLFPSVRWFFRRRAERVVAELNKRLERPIQPFKLLRRQDMLRRVLYDPEVTRAVAEHAKSEGVREDVAFERAERYAREIVPSFSASAYFGFAIRAARWLSNLLFDVRVHRVAPDALAGIDKDATVVFVINHRSNMDYVLVTYLAAEQSALSYAVGEWARVWPLSRLIRAMGAYFIRRKSHTNLYRRVLASYVEKATEAGVTQAVFPEGGLSRNGLVGPPKLGILSYIVSGHDPEGADVVFVPVSLNYDRVIEDRILVAANRSEKRRFKASTPEAIRFSLRYLRRRITGQVGRFGVAAVSFGAPIVLDKNADLENLGDALRDAIEANVPVVSAPLILSAIRRLGDETDPSRIQAEVRSLLDALPAHVPVDASADDVERELGVLTVRKLISEKDGRYSVVDDELAEFYINSIAHHFGESVET